eukprot:50555-Eustigmatos_ZCMA.PRE.1
MLQAKGEGIDSRVFKRVFLLLGREGRGNEAFELMDDLTQRGFRYAGLAARCSALMCSQYDGR